MKTCNLFSFDPYALVLIGLLCFGLARLVVRLFRGATRKAPPSREPSSKIVAIGEAAMLFCAVLVAVVWVMSCVR